MDRVVSVPHHVSMAPALQTVILWLRSRARADERGANLVEYAMLAAFIAVACMSAVAFFGINVATMFDNIRAQLLRT